MPKKYILIDTLKPLLKRWYNLLCEEGTKTKAQVRNEIKKYLSNLEAEIEVKENE